MVRNILIASLFLLPIEANANPKIERCESILTAGVYNDVLENICGFKGGVSNKLKEAYSRGGCPDLISTNKVYKLASEVSEDTEKRYIAFGEHDFCEKNLDAYSELSIAFKQGVDILKQNEFKQKK